MSESQESPPSETTGVSVINPAKPPPVPPRAHLITTAVKFLNNPNVVRSAINQKQSFLRSKGLTEEEIQLACEQAGIFTKDPNMQSQTVISMGVSPADYSKTNYAIQPHSTWLSRVKEMLSSVALISGVMYGVYLFYKNFIEPLIFRGKKKKSVKEQIADLNQTVEVKIDSINYELSQIKDELARVHQAQSNAKEMSNLKSDLDSIKGLLLNRKQFASPNLPIVPPSIPAWQLQSQVQRNEQTPNSEGETDKIDDNDTGSGSGSSENDVVLKNSDSSLEIIS